MPSTVTLPAFCAANAAAQASPRGRADTRWPTGSSARPGRGGGPASRSAPSVRRRSNDCAGAPVETGRTAAARVAAGVGTRIARARKEQQRNDDQRPAHRYPFVVKLGRSARLAPAHDPRRAASRWRRSRPAARRPTRRRCCCCTAWGTGPRRAWGRLVPQLDPAARYVAFDLPGFGASDKPDAGLRPALLPPRPRRRGRGAGARALRAGRPLAGRLPRRRLRRPAPRARRAAGADRAGGLRPHAALPRLRARQRRGAAGCSPAGRRAASSPASCGAAWSTRPRSTRRSSNARTRSRRSSRCGAPSPACTPAPSKRSRERARCTPASPATPARCSAPGARTTASSRVAALRAVERVYPHAQTLVLAAQRPPADDRRAGAARRTALRAFLAPTPTPRRIHQTFRHMYATAPNGRDFSEQSFSFDR